MLKKIRRFLAAVFFVCITLLFLDVSGTLHQWFGWMARVQFLPALLAMNFVVVAGLVAITLIFGRIYCSVVCPLGVMQDLIASLSGLVKRRGAKLKRVSYSYNEPITWLRYLALAIMIVGLFCGVGSVVAILAPYSSYGRMVTMLVQPLWALGNNVLAFLAERFDSYTFYSVDVWIKSLPTLLIASVTFVIVAVLAWKGGRTYCNAICPVGTVLGFVARWSYLKVRFDEEKCRNCSLCTKSCKASCLNYKTHSVDYSRCVVCGNCVEMCKFGALNYGTKKKTAEQGSGKSEESIDKSRRAFLLSTGLVATTVIAQEKKKVDGGLAKIEDKAIPERQTPLTPPGSLSAANMAHRCTGCQLCVSECPNGVLRPSSSLMTLMQPVMSYERGYCRPECTRCSQVCPAGAIRPIERAEKYSVQIGHAVWIKKNCLCVSQQVDCGNCSRHCPVGAIEMVPLDAANDESPFVPVVNEARCIGCGACEYVCPARPYPAIYVEGHEVHRSI